MARSMYGREITWKTKTRWYKKRYENVGRVHMPQVRVTVTGSSEHDNEPLGCIECRKYIDQPSKY